MMQAGDIRAMQDANSVRFEHRVVPLRTKPGSTSAVLLLRLHPPTHLDLGEPRDLGGLRLALAGLGGAHEVRVPQLGGDRRLLLAGDHGVLGGREIGEGGGPGAASSVGMVRA